MAIPIRTTITCPNCDTTDDVTMGDTSVGPAGRVSETPIYALLKNPLWDQTRRKGETYLTCTTCGEAEFVTLNELAKRMGRRRRPGGKPVKVKP